MTVKEPLGTSTSSHAPPPQTCTNSAFLGSWLGFFPADILIQYVSCYCLNACRPETSSIIMQKAHRANQHAQIRHVLLYLGSSAPHPTATGLISRFLISLSAPTLQSLNTEVSIKRSVQKRKRKHLLQQEELVQHQGSLVFKKGYLLKCLW